MRNKCMCVCLSVRWVFAMSSGQSAGVCVWPTTTRATMCQSRVALWPGLCVYCMCVCASHLCVCVCVICLSCVQVCGRPLSCGNHTCERVCHSGVCGQCPRAGNRSCFCGKTSECTHTHTHTTDLICENPAKVYFCHLMFFMFFLHRIILQKIIFTSYI